MSKGSDRRPGTDTLEILELMVETLRIIPKLLREILNNFEKILVGFNIFSVMTLTELLISKILEPGRSPGIILVL